MIHNPNQHNHPLFVTAMRNIIYHLRNIIHLHPTAIHRYVEGIKPTAQERKNEYTKHYQIYDATPLLPLAIRKQLDDPQCPYTTRRLVDKPELPGWSDKDDAPIPMHKLHPTIGFYWSLRLSPHIIHNNDSDLKGAMTHSLYNERYVVELWKKKSTQVLRFIMLDINNVILHRNKYPKFKFLESSRWELALLTGRWNGRWWALNEGFGWEECYLCNSPTICLTNDHLFTCPALHEERMDAMADLRCYLIKKKIDMHAIAEKTQQEEENVRNLAESLRRGYSILPNYTHVLTAPLDPLAIYMRHNNNGLDHNRFFEVTKWMTRDEVNIWLIEQKVRMQPLWPAENTPQYNAVQATFTRSYCHLLLSEQYVLMNKVLLSWLLHTESSPQDVDLVFYSLSDSGMLLSPHNHPFLGQLYWHIRSYLTLDYLQRIKPRIFSRR